MELRKRDWYVVAQQAAEKATLELRTGGREDQIRYLLNRAVEAMKECEKADD